MADKTIIPPTNVDQVEPQPTTTAASSALPWWTGLGAEASHAASVEKAMSLRQALGAYPKAVFWSCAISLVIIMDGYDTALIGSFFAYPAFQQRFGIPTGPDTFQVQAKWQTALGLASTLGSIVGIFVSGVLTERYGHKRVLLGAMAWLVACVFIIFFAPSVGVLFAGELLCGLAWGMFATMGSAYASEVAPVALRAYLETCVVVCWGLGQLVANSILDSLNTRKDQWAWRIPVAVQWAWPVLIVPLVVFCPESPWWLVRQGRLQEAEHSFKRLSSATPSEAQAAIALMVETTELERSLSEGDSYRDCFRGGDLWRTEISCIAWASQAFLGFAIVSYAVYFYEMAGLPTTAAYKMSLGQSGLHLVCNGLSVIVGNRHGRRPIYIWGALFMSCMMFLIGFLALARQTPAIGYASSALFLVWFCAYEMTVGPASFVIVGETSSTKLRSKTIALARNAYNLANIVSLTVAPYCLNPTEGNWKGKTAFLAAGFGLLTAFWAYFRLPECKGRTYEELDLLFNQNLRAWEFASYQVNPEQHIEAKTMAEHNE
ncbi:hypothetical protein SEUCBS139899_009566 [Sporothrix eucalyptigena]|uniref:Major facilitator superfamily (MFS) profile domain-containing protein n=1 Tax=Sporothrix eucalyptigena TaxID=1812306 RepID=A0ABP0C5P8_9PEZI